MRAPILNVSLFSSPAATPRNPAGNRSARTSRGPAGSRGALALCLGIGLLLAGAACRSEPDGDPQLEALLQSLIEEAAEDTSGACDARSVAGGRELQVRSTSSTSTTYCSLSTGARIEPGAPDWDMSFRRFQLGTNSGTSGGGDGGACRTGQTDFAAITSVPSSGGGSDYDCPTFVVDETLEGTSGGLGGASPIAFSGNAALKDWYAYDIFTHTLSAKPEIYIVRGRDGSTYYKVQMLDYYDSAGTSGYPRLRWAEVSGP